MDSRLMAPIMAGADLPLHTQLKNHICAQIRAGVLKPDDMLPGERQLAQDLDLSRTTVRQALSELVAEGVLYRRHGKGTYVAPNRLEQNLTWLKGFAEELREQNMNPAVRILAARLEPAPAEVAARLNLSEDT